MKNVEEVLEQSRQECLRGLESNSMSNRLAWFYTHCGAIELAGQLGAITLERMNELETDWRRHMPEQYYYDLISKSELLKAIALAHKAPDAFVPQREVTKQDVLTILRNFKPAEPVQADQLPCDRAKATAGERS